MLQITNQHHTIDKNKLHPSDPRKEGSNILNILLRFSIVFMAVVFPFTIFKKTLKYTTTETILIALLAICVGIIFTVILTKRANKIFPNSANADCYFVKSKEFYCVTYDNYENFVYFVKVLYKGSDKLLYLDNYFVRDQWNFPNTEFKLYRSAELNESLDIEFLGEVIDPIESFHLKYKNSYLDGDLLDYDIDKTIVQTINNTNS